MPVPEPIKKHFRRGRWTVGLVSLPIDEVIRRRALPEPCWLGGQPAGRFYADPFPLGREGDAVRMLVEDYAYRARRGRIAELLVGLDGRVRGARPALDFPHHASYPFVLRRGGELYCVPETFEAGRAAAYARTPAGWVERARLLDEPLVDPTIVEHDGRWWLFATRPKDEASLYLYAADDPLGPWRPHPANPVKRDVASARPAGPLVVVDGELYRPGQDCSVRYGGAVAVNRVLELSPTAYREEIAFRLRPDPASRWPDGLHHLAGIGDLTLVDGLRFDYGLWLGR